MKNENALEGFFHHTTDFVDWLTFPLSSQPLVKMCRFHEVFNVSFVALVFSVPRTMKPAILSGNTVAWILWYLFHSMLKIRSYSPQPQALFGSVPSAAKM